MMSLKQSTISSNLFPLIFCYEEKTNKLFGCSSHRRFFGFLNVFHFFLNILLFLLLKIARFFEISGRSTHETLDHSHTPAMLDALHISIMLSFPRL
jgi:ABC-type sulfate transport system permease component